MKRTTLYLIILFIGLVAAFASCKKSTNIQLDMYYLGATRNYEVNAIVNLNPDSGNLVLSGAQYGTLNTVKIRVSGLNTGDYVIADTGILNYMRIIKGYTNYTTQTPGGWALLSITKLDTGSFGAKGTFSGTVINPLNPADSFKVTQGVFYVPCQYKP